MTVSSSVKTLVLNSDYTLLNAVTWKNGIKLTFDSPCKACDGQGKKHRVICSICEGSGVIPAAKVVEYYDLWIRDSMGRQHPVPAVIVNARHIKKPHKNVPFSKKNVFQRDNFTCQYCGKQFSSELLTIDHVIPRSIWRKKEGSSPTCWKNIVASCVKCNRKKANKTPEQANMILKKNYKRCFCRI